MLAWPWEFGARHVPLPSGTLANRSPAELLCRKAPFVLAGAFSWACANQTAEVAAPCQPVLHKGYNAGRSSFCVIKGTAKHA